MARLSIRVGLSTDLTPEQRVYIDRLTSYIDLHTTSFVNNTQYLVPRRHVLWQYIVSCYTPLVGLCFHRSKAPFQSYDPTLGGILTLIPRQCRPSKISVKSIPSSKPISQYPPEFLSRLQGNTLRAIVP